MARDHTALIVMAYDVSDDRKRNAVHKLLQQYGVWVQLSVFEARLDREERRVLLARVARLLDMKIDSFVMYSIGKGQESDVVSLGRPRPEVREEEFLIV